MNRNHSYSRIKKNAAARARVDRGRGRVTATAANTVRLPGHKFGRASDRGGLAKGRGQLLHKSSSSEESPEASSSKTRGPGRPKKYNFSPNVKARIGRYASQHGVKAAKQKFKLAIGDASNYHVRAMALEHQQLGATSAESPEKGEQGATPPEQCSISTTVRNLTKGFDSAGTSSKPDKEPLENSCDSDKGLSDLETSQTEKSSTKATSKMSTTRSSSFVEKSDAYDFVGTPSTKTIQRNVDDEISFALQLPHTDSSEASTVEHAAKKNLDAAGVDYVVDEQKGNEKGSVQSESVEKVVKKRGRPPKALSSSSLNVTVPSSAASDTDIKHSVRHARTRRGSTDSTSSLTRHGTRNSSVESERSTTSSVDRRASLKGRLHPEHSVSSRESSPGSTTRSRSNSMKDSALSAKAMPGRLLHKRSESATSKKAAGYLAHLASKEHRTRSSSVEKSSIVQGKTEKNATHDSMTRYSKKVVSGRKEIKTPDAWIQRMKQTLGTMPKRRSSNADSDTSVEKSSHSGTAVGHEGGTKFDELSDRSDASGRNMFEYFNPGSTDISADESGVVDDARRTKKKAAESASNARKTETTQQKRKSKVIELEGLHPLDAHLHLHNTSPQPLGRRGRPKRSVIQYRKQQQALAQRTQQSPPPGVTRPGVIPLDFKPEPGAVTDWGLTESRGGRWTDEEELDLEKALSLFIAEYQVPSSDVCNEVMRLYPILRVRGIERIKSKCETIVNRNQRRFGKSNIKPESISPPTADQLNSTHSTTPLSSAASTSTHLHSITDAGSSFYTNLNPTKRPYKTDIVSPTVGGASTTRILRNTGIDLKTGRPKRGCTKKQQDAEGGGKRTYKKRHAGRGRPPIRKWTSSYTESRRLVVTAGSTVSYSSNDELSASDAEFPCETFSKKRDHIIKRNIQSKGRYHYGRQGIRKAPLKLLTDDSHQYLREFRRPVKRRRKRSRWAKGTIVKPRAGQRKSLEYLDSDGNQLKLTAEQLEKIKKQNAIRSASGVNRKSKSGLTRVDNLLMVTDVEGTKDPESVLHNINTAGHISSQKAAYLSTGATQHPCYGEPSATQRTGSSYVELDFNSVENVQNNTDNILGEQPAQQGYYELDFNQVENVQDQNMCSEYSMHTDGELNAMNSNATGMQHGVYNAPNTDGFMSSGVTHDYAGEEFNQAEFDAAFMEGSNTYSEVQASAQTVQETVGHSGEPENGEACLNYDAAFLDAAEKCGSREDMSQNSVGVDEETSVANSEGTVLPGSFPESEEAGQSSGANDNMHNASGINEELSAADSGKNAQVDCIQSDKGIAREGCSDSVSDDAVGMHEQSLNTDSDENESVNSVCEGDKTVENVANDNDETHKCDETVDKCYREVSVLQEAATPKDESVHSQQTCEPDVSGQKSSEPEEATHSDSPEENMDTDATDVDMKQKLETPEHDLPKGADAGSTSPKENKTLEQDVSGKVATSVDIEEKINETVKPEISENVLTLDTLKDTVKMTTPFASYSTSGKNTELDKKLSIDIDSEEKSSPKTEFCSNTEYKSPRVPFHTDDLTDAHPVTASPDDRSRKRSGTWPNQSPNSKKAFLGELKLVQNKSSSEASKGAAKKGAKRCRQVINVPLSIKRARRLSAQQSSKSGCNESARDDSDKCWYVLEGEKEVNKLILRKGDMKEIRRHSVDTMESTGTGVPSTGADTEAHDATLNLLELCKPCVVRLPDIMYIMDAANTLSLSPTSSLESMISAVSPSSDQGKSPPSAVTSPNVTDKAHTVHDVLSGECSPAKKQADTITASKDVNSAKDETASNVPNRNDSVEINTNVKRKCKNCSNFTCMSVEKMRNHVIAKHLGGVNITNFGRDFVKTFFDEVKVEKKVSSKTVPERKPTRIQRPRIPCLPNVDLTKEYFQCCHCTFASNDEHPTREHVLSQHRVELEYSCPHCEKKAAAEDSKHAKKHLTLYKQVSSMRKHILQVHPGEAMLLRLQDGFYSVPGSLLEVWTGNKRKTPTPPAMMSSSDSGFTSVKTVITLANTVITATSLLSTPKTAPSASTSNTSTVSKAASSKSRSVTPPGRSTAGSTTKPHATTAASTVSVVTAGTEVKTTTTTARKSTATARKKEISDEEKAMYEQFKLNPVPKPPVLAKHPIMQQTLTHPATVNTSSMHRPITANTNNLLPQAVIATAGNIPPYTAIANAKDIPSHAAIATTKGIPPRSAIANARSIPHQAVVANTKGIPPIANNKGIPSHAAIVNKDIPSHGAVANAKSIPHQAVVANTGSRPSVTIKTHVVREPEYIDLSQLSRVPKAELRAVAAAVERSKTKDTGALDLTKLPSSEPKKNATNSNLTQNSDTKQSRSSSNSPQLKIVSVRSLAEKTPSTRGFSSIDPGENLVSAQIESEGEDDEDDDVVTTGVTAPVIQSTGNKGGSASAAAAVGGAISGGAATKGDGAATVKEVIITTKPLGKDSDRPQNLAVTRQVKNRPVVTVAATPVDASSRSHIVSKPVQRTIASTTNSTGHTVSISTFTATGADHHPPRAVVPGTVRSAPVASVTSQQQQQQTLMSDGESSDGDDDIPKDAFKVFNLAAPNRTHRLPPVPTLQARPATPTTPSTVNHRGLQVFNIGAAAQNPSHAHQQNNVNYQRRSSPLPAPPILQQRQQAQHNQQQQQQQQKDLMWQQFSIGRGAAAPPGLQLYGHHPAFGRGPQLSTGAAFYSGVMPRVGQRPPGIMALGGLHGSNPARVSPFLSGSLGGAPNSTPTVNGSHRVHKCPYCSYQTTDGDNLHDHILGHGPNINWSCPYCPQPNQMSKSSVARHIETTHPGCHVVYIPFGVSF